MQTTPFLTRGRGMVSRQRLEGVARAFGHLPDSEAASFTFERTALDTLMNVRFTADLSRSAGTLKPVPTSDSLSHGNGGGGRKD